jgi:predicted nucleic acid-binding protein
LRLSAVTIAELHHGVAVAPDPLSQMTRRRRVQAVLDRFEVLPFDVGAAEYYGALAALAGATAELAGERIARSRSEPDNEVRTGRR